jgi:hypothetical protein
MTPRVENKKATLNIITLHTPMLGFIYAVRRKYAHFAECQYDECHKAKGCYSVYHYTECLNANRYHYDPQHN